jgi:hypothetical protein
MKWTLRIFFVICVPAMLSYFMNFMVTLEYWDSIIHPVKNERLAFCADLASVGGMICMMVTIFMALRLYPLCWAFSNLEKAKEEYENETQELRKVKQSYCEQIDIIFKNNESIKNLNK